MTPFGKKLPDRAPPRNSHDLPRGIPPDLSPWSPDANYGITHMAISEL